MAVGDPNLRYATNTLDADGVTTDWEISFVGGYIKPENVGCFSVVVDPDTGLATDRQVHAVSILSSSENAATVRVSPAVEDGRKIVIYRDTKKDAMLVLYEDGSILSKKNLDLANKQLLMLIQEILDGQNISSLSVEQAVSTVIEVNELVQSIYQQVIDLLEAGGIVSVDPRVWVGTGDGETTDFAIEGADVSGSGFYDTYLEGAGLEPGTDYTIILAEYDEPSKIRFTTAPGDGEHWFTVLRGYAKPYTGPAPVTSLRIPVLDTNVATYYISKVDEFSLISSGNDESAEFFVPLIPESGDSLEKLDTGSFLSITQAGLAQVEVAADDEAVELRVPAGYLPKTRAVNSTISLTCISGDGNIWLLSGDLAKDE